MYILKTSKDLGCHYEKQKESGSLDSLKKQALDLEKTHLRWVIVDEDDDEPVYWCKYIEANLKVPKDAAITTEDPYMRKLAIRHGFKVLDFADMAKMMGLDIPHVNIRDVEWTPEEAKKALNFMDKMVEKGVFDVIPSEMDEKAIGKELFGKSDADIMVDKIIKDLK